MHPEQVEAIRIVSEGVDRLADALCKHCDLCEDDALDIVRDLPDLVVGLQAGDHERLIQEAVRRVKRPKNLKFDAPDPDEKYPFHPKFRPKVTTPTTFNEHFSQAAKPHIVAILKRIAKDRNLEEPDSRTVQAVLDNIDWAKAAYEAKQLPENPTKQQIKRVIKKLWSPVAKAVDFLPFEWAWYAILGTATSIYLFKMLKGAFDVESDRNTFYRGMNTVLGAHEKWSRRRTFRQQYKGSRR